MAKQKASFDLIPYKINKLYANNAKKIYNLCKLKYMFNYLDMKLANKLYQILLFGMKIKEKFLYGLLFAIFTSSKFNSRMKYKYFYLERY